MKEKVCEERCEDETKEITMSKLSKKEKARIVLQYAGDVKHYLSYLGLTKEILDDAVEDTLSKAWINIDSVRDTASIKNWIIAIAKNEGLKYIKQTNKELNTLYPLEESVLCKETASNHVHGDVLSEIIEESDKKCLYDAIAKLPLKERTVIELFYIEGKPLKEISDEINESYVNTRVIASRARKRLKTILIQKYL